MVLRYPNGQPYHKNASLEEKIQEKRKAPIEFGNRGMRFEEAINESNEYYLARQIAVIHKKPTPIQIVKVDYPRRSAAVIKEAYFTQASTTDYNGVYRGFYLDFEAKETKNKTSFPFKKLSCASNQPYGSLSATKWDLFCLIMVFIFEALLLFK